MWMKMKASSVNYNYSMYSYSLTISVILTLISTSLVLANTGDGRSLTQQRRDSRPVLGELRSRALLSLKSSSISNNVPPPLRRIRRLKRVNKKDNEDINNSTTTIKQKRSPDYGSHFAVDNYTPPQILDMIQQRKAELSKKLLQGQQAQGGPQVPQEVPDQVAMPSEPVSSLLPEPIPDFPPAPPPAIKPETSGPPPPANSVTRFKFTIEPKPATVVDYQQAPLRTFAEHPREEERPNHTPLLPTYETYQYDPHPLNRGDHDNHPYSQGGREIEISGVAHPHTGNIPPNPPATGGYLHDDPRIQNGVQRIIQDYLTPQGEDQGGVGVEHYNPPPPQNHHNVPLSEPNPSNEPLPTHGVGVAAEEPPYQDYPPQDQPTLSTELDLVQLPDDRKGKPRRTKGKGWGRWDDSEYDGYTPGKPPGGWGWDDYDSYSHSVTVVKPKHELVAQLLAEISWKIVSSYIFVFLANSLIALLGKYLGLSDSALEAKITLGKDGQHPFAKNDVGGGGGHGGDGGGSGHRDDKFKKKHSHSDKNWLSKPPVEKDTYYLNNPWYHPASALYNHPTYQYYPKGKEYTLLGYDQYHAVKYAKKYGKKYTKKSGKYGLKPKPILPYIPAQYYGKETAGWGLERQDLKLMKRRKGVVGGSKKKKKVEVKVKGESEEEEEPEEEESAEEGEEQPETLELEPVVDQEIVVTSTPDNNEDGAEGTTSVPLVVDNPVTNGDNDNNNNNTQTQSTQETPWTIPTSTSSPTTSQFTPNLNNWTSSSPVVIYPSANFLINLNDPNGTVRTSTQSSLLSSQNSTGAI